MRHTGCSGAAKIMQRPRRESIYLVPIIAIFFRCVAHGPNDRDIKAVLRARKAADRSVGIRRKDEADLILDARQLLKHRNRLIAERNLVGAVILYPLPRQRPEPT